MMNRMLLSRLILSIPFILSDFFSASDFSLWCKQPGYSLV